MTNISEDIISEINSNIFFKEFTFHNTVFKDFKNNLELQFSDNIIWIDNVLLIFEIKQRESRSTDEKWFKNKIISKAVSQIKTTITYLEKYSEIKIENKRGHTLNIVEAKNCIIRKVIIYVANSDMPERIRFRKFHLSSDIGYIHLFHVEDYYWICQYLHTPTEIEEYFDFRENLYNSIGSYSNELPEQYFLAHFLNTIETDHINLEYLEKLKSFDLDKSSFDVSTIINNFENRAGIKQDDTNYYEIIKQIAKLNRAELSEFKLRWVKMIQTSEEDKFDFPYRIFVPATNCSFIFIPISKQESVNAKILLENLTILHKYDTKAHKCVGVCSYLDVQHPEIRQIDWAFIEGDWIYEEEIEKQLKNQTMFRKIKNKYFGNLYQ